MSKKILTVDDSKMVRMIVTSTFQPFDCVVVGAADGAEGVEVALREKPDIIFLEITMPVLNGIETLAKIRETPEIAATPPHRDLGRLAQWAGAATTTPPSLPP